MPKKLYLQFCSILLQYRFTTPGCALNEMAGTSNLISKGDKLFGNSVTS